MIKLILPIFFCLRSINGVLKLRNFKFEVRTQNEGILLVRHQFLRGLLVVANDALPDVIVSVEVDFMSELCCNFLSNLLIDGVEHLLESLELLIDISECMILFNCEF